MPVNPLKISFIGKLQSKTSHSSMCYGQCVLDFGESAQKFANIIFRSSHKCFSFHCQRDVSIMCSATSICLTARSVSSACFAIKKEGERRKNKETHPHSRFHSMAPAVCRTTRLPYKVMCELQVYCTSLTASNGEICLRRWCQTK